MAILYGIEIVSKTYGATSAAERDIVEEMTVSHICEPV